MVCFTDGVLCCRQCIVAGGHGGHGVAPMSSSSANIRRAFTSMLPVFRAGAARFGSAVASANAAKAALSAKVAVAANTCTAVFAAVKERATAACAVTGHRISAVCDSQMKRLDSIESASAVTAAQLDAACRVMQCAADVSDATTLAHMWAAVSRMRPLAGSSSLCVSVGSGGAAALQTVSTEDVCVCFWMCLRTRRLWMRPLQAVSSCERCVICWSSVQAAV